MTDPRVVVSLVRNVPIPKRAKVVILVHFWRNPACNPLVYHTGISRPSRRKGAFRSELPWLFGKFAVKEGPGKNPRAQPRELPTWTRAKGFQRYPLPFLLSGFSVRLFWRLLRSGDTTYVFASEPCRPTPFDSLRGP